MATTPILPPGVSQDLLNSLPNSTLFFDGQGQAGNWEDSLNWWGRAVPVASSVVVVPVSGTLNGSFTAQNVMFLGSETVTINGVLNTLEQNYCESFMVCDDAVAVFTPGAALNAAGALIVGFDDVGTLIANGSGADRATLTSLDSRIGHLDDGAGNMTLNDAVWNNSTFIDVGEHGVGTLTVTNGSVVTTGGEVHLGVCAGATGQLALTNGGTLNVGGGLCLGSGPNDLYGSGSGTVTVGVASQLTVANAVLVYANDVISLSGGSLTAAPASPTVAKNGGFPFFWLTPGSVLSGYGTVTSASCGVTDCGTITAIGGTLMLNGPLLGTGVLTIAAASTADINASFLGAIAIEFTGQAGTLQLSTGIDDYAVIHDFAAGDSIVMAGVNQFAWNGTTDQLTLKENRQTVDHIQFSGCYTGNPFTLSQSAAGAVITISAGRH